MITLLDYGAGNVRVRNAVEKLGVPDHGDVP